MSKQDTTAKDVRDWILNRKEDYFAVWDRLSYCRNILLNGRIDAAVRMLKRSYTFAVMSIQTSKDRHEDAFVSHYSGKLRRKEAYLQTVYGGQKFNWDRKTFKNVNWSLLVLAIRKHVENNRFDVLLDVIVDQLTGVSHRKGAFMLSMIGITEYMCIDSNVAQFADIDTQREYNSSGDYLSDCKQIVKAIDMPHMPNFIIQWAIYDVQRGEHSRHMAFYREVLYTNE